MGSAEAGQQDIQSMADDIKTKLLPGEIVQLMRLITPTPTTGEMSLSEFENLMTELDEKSTRRGYSDTSKTAARLVLVMGATVPEAAAETQVSKQAIYQLLRRIRRRTESLPKGWVQVSAWLPEAIARDLENIAATLKRDCVAGEGLKGFSLSLQGD